MLGREEDLNGVSAKLRDPAVLLLTLTGPGGIGKTRLALEAASRARQDFSGGVFFVSLAEVSEPRVDTKSRVRVHNNFYSVPASLVGRKVAVRLSRDERMVEIAVEDNGPGIPEQLREEAFRPFHRLDEGRNLQSGGSGLGLAIARDIARAHGGEILLDQSAMGDDPGRPARASLRHHRPRAPATRRPLFGAIGRS